MYKIQLISLPGKKKNIFKKKVLVLKTHSIKTGLQRYTKKISKIRGIIFSLCKKNVHEHIEIIIVNLITPLRNFKSLCTTNFPKGGGSCS